MQPLDGRVRGNEEVECSIDSDRCSAVTYRPQLIEQLIGSNRIGVAAHEFEHLAAQRCECEPSRLTQALRVSQQSGRIVVR